MKHLLLIICLIPTIAFSQTKADYERTVANFMRFYNNDQADSVVNQYSDEWGETKKRLWSKEKNEDIKKEYGAMKSYKFMELYRNHGDGGGDGVALFKVVFAKSTHAMGISLSKDNKLLTFRFKTSSGHIDSLLRKN